jgi:hypothetical protein
MRYLTAFAICSLCSLGSEPNLLAKQWPIDAPQGSTVVLKVPVNFWKIEDTSVSTPAPIYTVDSSAVIASSRWETTGLPYFGQFVVTKVFEPRLRHTPRYTDVELRNATAWVRLRFQAGSDIGAQFNLLTFAGDWSKFEATDYCKTVVYGAVGSKLFTGPLSNIPDSSKLALLRIAGKGRETLSSESYQDKVYVGFSLPPSGTVYNSNKLNKYARVATVVNSRLDLLKSMAAAAGDAGLEGVKVTQQIRYRNYLLFGTQARSDTLELYAPRHLIEQFAAADITNQQFIHQSVSILNSKRVEPRYPR